VPDVAAQVARLRARGVTFEAYDFGEIKTVDGIMTDPTGGRTAWFKDPDGNTIAILEAAGGGTGHSLSAMLAAADLDRARAWYSDRLGFEPVAEFPGFVMDYRSGDTAFNVYKTDFAGSAKNTVAVWRMKGIRDEVGRLKARGVVFEEYDFGDEGWTVGGILSDDDGDVNAWFKDSEGNILALAEDRA
jgi:catechol 2,3-dioxygenase-like lactoylglutathione lyase family enzyme